MGVFFCLYGFILLIELLTNGQDNSKKVRAYKAITFGVAVWLVLALRSPQNGTDLAAYCNRFPLFAELSIKDCIDNCFHWNRQGFEPGFVLLNKMITVFSTDVQVFLATVSFFTIAPITYVIYKYSDSVYISFLVFICFGLFNICFTGLRQSLAFGITLWSIKYIIENKPIKFGCIILLAMSFHTSAMLFSIAWVFRYVNLSFRNGFTYFTIYILSLFVGAKYIFYSVTRLFFGNKYDHYLQDSNGAFTLAIIYVVIVFWGLYNGTKYSCPKNSIIKASAFVAACIQSICIFGFTGVARIAYYFSILFCLFIPLALTNLNKSSKQLVSAIVVFLFIVFHYLSISTGVYDICPYHFFWEPGYNSPQHFTF